MKRYILVLLAVLLSVGLAGAQDENPATLIPDLAAGLNLWRLGEGLGPLVYSPTLEAMAAAQADYLIGLPHLPDGGELHTGPRGEDVRARSQESRFAWPTYGHPQRIAVTEIAAIGDVELALDYWHHSDIHSRSVRNPAYREVGIAARQLNNRNKDVLFIVVLGGQPNFLPALADAEVNQLYLTTEGSAWSGAWIAAPTRYRLLDLEHQPLQDWQDWQIIVPLPEGLEADRFIVEYEDAGGKRAETEVPLQPIWTSALPAPTVLVAQASTPVVTQAASGGGLFATNTPGGVTGFGFATNTPSVGFSFATNTATPPPPPTSTPAPTRTPFPTAVPGNVSLTYDENVLTLISRSEGADLTTVSFRNGSVTFEARRWEAVTTDLNIGALPAGHCLQVGQQGADFAAPGECRFVRSIVTLGADRLFWTGGTFEVLDDGTAVATCDSAAESCEVTLP